MTTIASRHLRPTGNGPLGELVVIDLTRVLAGPYCTMILADLGARIIKVEMPDVGDDSRHIGPFIPNDSGAPASGYFFSVNRNKESIALSLKEPADRLIFEALLADADILVENFTPGTMARFGYDWPTLSARFPRLILASISGFGQTGPYRELPAYDMVVQAMGGVMSLTGEEGGAPTRVGVSIGDLAAGMFAAVGIQAAIIERTRTCNGKHVDIAMLDSQVALLENAVVRCQLEGVSPGPIGSRHPSITPFGVFKAKSGHLVLAAGNDRNFAHLCDMIGLPSLTADARFSSNAERCAHHAELIRLIEEALAGRTAEEWLAILQEAGLPCGPLNDVAAVLRDPQLQARDMFVPFDVPGRPGLMAAASPIRFADEDRFRYRSAPDLDADRLHILREIKSDAAIEIS